MARANAKGFRLYYFEPSHRKSAVGGLSSFIVIGVVGPLLEIIKIFEPTPLSIAHKVGLAVLNVVDAIWIVGACSLIVRTLLPQVVLNDDGIRVRKMFLFRTTLSPKEIVCYSSEDLDAQRPTVSLQTVDGETVPLPSYLVYDDILRAWIRRFPRCGRRTVNPSRELLPWNAMPQEVVGMPQ